MYKHGKLDYICDNNAQLAYSHAQVSDELWYGGRLAKVGDATISPRYMSGDCVAGTGSNSVIS